MSWAGGGGNYRDSLHSGQTPRTLEPVLRAHHSSQQPGFTVTHHSVFTLKWTAGFALKPLPQPAGNWRLTRPTAKQQYKGGAEIEGPKNPKEGKTLVKTEMAEGDRDELTVLVAPKQNQATVGLSGGGLAEPSALPWATLTALAGPGGSAGPSDPNYSDQMLT